MLLGDLIGLSSLLLLIQISLLQMFRQMECPFLRSLVLCRMEQKLLLADFLVLNSILLTITNLFHFYISLSRKFPLCQKLMMLYFAILLLEDWIVLLQLLRECRTFQILSFRLQG